jgi:two-component system chemotaxis response regulator CheB
VAPPDAGRDIARILVCEDSRAFAAGLKLFLERDDDLRVVGVAATGEEALSAVPRLRPDLVTMDIELPGMTGIEATRRIVARHDVPILVVSSHTPRGSERAAAALAAGAVDVVAKSYVRLDDPMSAAAVALRRRIKRLARVRTRRIGGLAAPAAAAPRHVPGRNLHRRASVVAIGASTGGPQALLQVLSMLPADYRLPVLVVQHMSAGFTVGLARWLHQQVSLPVAIAEDGSPLRPGVWFAPEDVHLVLDKSMRMALDGNTDVGVHRPSVDVMLDAVARTAAGGAVGVVLTGMGRDGAAGIAAVRSAGGLTIAQDESTSVVWGMPRAAAESGAELVLPLPEIGSTLAALAPRRAET